VTLFKAGFLYITAGGLSIYKS